MRFVVFKCRKCKCRLCVENTDDIMRSIKRVSNTDCPECGADPVDNWVLDDVINSLPESLHEKKEKAPEAKPPERKEALRTIPRLIFGDCFHGEIWYRCPHCGCGIEAHGIPEGISECHRCGGEFYYER